MADAKPAADKGTGKFSPFAGCSIFIIAGCLALGMIGFTTWSYFKVKEKIESFTGENPKPITLVETKGKEAEQTALKSKFVGFRHHIEAKHKSEMTLNANEINLAIATFDILKPHRNNLYITAIRDGQIEAQVSYPVKSSLGSDQMRYLTGTIIIEPELVEGGAIPRIVESRPDKKGSIPEEFKKLISDPSWVNNIYSYPKVFIMFMLRSFKVWTFSMGMLTPLGTFILLSLLALNKYYFKLGEKLTLSYKMGKVGLYDLFLILGKSQSPQGVLDSLATDHEWTC